VENAKRDLRRWSSSRKILRYCVPCGGKIAHRAAAKPARTAGDELATSRSEDVSPANHVSSFHPTPSGERPSAFAQHRRWRSSPPATISVTSRAVARSDGRWIEGPHDRRRGARYRRLAKNQNGKRKPWSSFASAAAIHSRPWSARKAVQAADAHPHSANLIPDTSSGSIKKKPRCSGLSYDFSHSVNASSLT
jgi:hypothetical protein